MTHRAFKACSVRYGDRLVRGFEASCGKCGMPGQFHVNTIKGHSDTAKREAQETARKFEQNGWRIGARPQDDRCPACVRAEDAARKARLKIVSREKQMPTAAEPPREMTREDKRVIFAKLEECYRDEKHGYHSGWTDQKVATDLGVPRAWVEDIRKQFFGPEGTNPEISTMLAEAKSYLEEARPIFEKINGIKAQLGSLVAEAQKLTTRGEMIERKLANIEKDLR